MSMFRRSSVNKSSTLEKTRKQTKAEKKKDKNLAAQSMVDIYGAPVEILAAARAADSSGGGGATSYDHPEGDDDEPDASKRAPMPTPGGRSLPSVPEPAAGDDTYEDIGADGGAGGGGATSYDHDDTPSSMPAAAAMPQGFPQGFPGQPQQHPGMPQGFPQGFPGQPPQQHGMPQGFPQGFPGQPQPQHGMPQGFPQGFPGQPQQHGMPQGFPQGFPGQQQQQGMPPGFPQSAQQFPQNPGAYAMQSPAGYQNQMPGQPGMPSVSSVTQDMSYMGMGGGDGGPGAYAVQEPDVGPGAYAVQEPADEPEEDTYGTTKDFAAIAAQGSVIRKGTHETVEDLYGEMAPDADGNPDMGGFNATATADPAAIPGGFDPNNPFASAPPSGAGGGGFPAGFPGAQQQQPQGYQNQMPGGAAAFPNPGAYAVQVPTGMPQQGGMPQGFPGQQQQFPGQQFPGQQYPGQPYPQGFPGQQQQFPQGFPTPGAGGPQGQYPPQAYPTPSAGPGAYAVQEPDFPGGGEGDYDLDYNAKQNPLVKVRKCRTEWFHPEMSRKDAEVKLRGKDDGRFVIRKSSQEGFYSLTVLKADRTFWNGLIKNAKGKFNMQGRTAPFDTLEQLVHELMTDDDQISLFKMPCKLVLPPM